MMNCKTKKTMHYHWSVLKPIVSCTDLGQKFGEKHIVMSQTKNGL